MADTPTDSSISDSQASSFPSSEEETAKSPSTCPKEVVFTTTTSTTSSSSTSTEAEKEPVKPVKKKSGSTKNNNALLPSFFKTLMNLVMKLVMKFMAAFLQSKAGGWLMRTKIVRTLVHSGAASNVLGQLPPGAASILAHMMTSEDPPVYTLPYGTATFRVSKLDREYYAGTGDRLWCTDKYGTPQQVIDFVGGYGTNLLGHNHPEIQQAAIDFHSSPAIALSDQGSTRYHGEHALAQKLSQTVGEYTHNSNSEYYVRFASTGAEAVEMALAHACLEREEKVLAFIRQQRLHFGAHVPELVQEVEEQLKQALSNENAKVLTLRGAYHGKTLGARSLIGNPAIKSPFISMMKMEPIVLPLNQLGDEDEDQVNLEDIVKQETMELPAIQWNKETGKPEKTTFIFNRIVAAIAEPILGEGGVCLPNRNLLASLKGHDFPVVFDEIQCGLGRSGQFLASQGLHGDYYVFAKALGGGVAKISALLVARDRYIGRFDSLYSSTFAGDNFSCTIAQKVLKIIQRDNIPQRAKERGEVLKKRCQEELVDRYPHIIKSVSGQGLMLGVEINTHVTEDNWPLRVVHTDNHLGWCVASYLLNRHNIRVLPTLSAPNVLRLEPSAFIDDEAIDALIVGLTKFCEAVEKQDVLHLFGYVLDDSLVNRENLLKPGLNLPGYTCKIETPHPDAHRVLFISHSTSPEIEAEWMHPDWRALNPVARVDLMRQMSAVVDYKPTIGNAQNLLNNKVWFLNMMVPFDAVQMAVAGMGGEGKPDMADMVRSIEEALQVGKDHGCTVGVLGGFSSIVTKNGMSVCSPPGMRVSTGNSFTVAVGMRRLQDYCREKKIDLNDPDTRVAIVGATGNIGNSMAQQIVRKLPVTRMTLISRTVEKLERMKDQLLALHQQEKGEDAGAGAGAGAFDIKVSTEMSDMSECNIIVIALATGKPIVFPEHLHPEREILLADLSVPSSVSSEASAMPNLKKVPIGGTVRLPGESDFVLHPLVEPGNIFCCSAEAMLLGLEPEKTVDLNLRGDIEQKAVDTLEEIGEQYNFFAKLGEASFRPPDLSGRK